MEFNGKILSKSSNSIHVCPKNHVRQGIAEFEALLYCSEFCMGQKLENDPWSLKGTFLHMYILT